MNLALFVQSGIFRSLQTLVRWCATNDTTNPRRVMLHTQAGQRNAPISIANSSTIARAGAIKCSIKKPLRVVRIVEPGQSRSSVGRIVISGRMADVCAELDRLAACEAALS
jgi:hypothetical protein